MIKLVYLCCYDCYAIHNDTDDAPPKCGAQATLSRVKSMPVWLFVWHLAAVCALPSTAVLRA